MAHEHLIPVALYRNQIMRRCDPYGGAAGWHQVAEWEIELLKGNGDNPHRLPHLVERLTAELPPAAIAHAIRPIVYVPQTACGGSRWVRSFDTDYPCSGCDACEPVKCRTEWAASMLPWAIATHLERERLAATVMAMQCLANIGKAIEAALSLGDAFVAFIEKAAKAWSEITVGRWYRVQASRGNSVPFNGMEGVLERIETSTYGGYYDRRAGHVGGRSTDRGGIRIPGRAELVWVNAYTQLVPVPMPADVAARLAADKRAETERKQIAADVAAELCKGDIVYTKTGVRGKVFWIGERRGVKRIGMETGTRTRSMSKAEQDALTVWIDACDVRKDKPFDPLTDGALLAEMAILSLVRIVQLALDAADVPVMLRHLGFAKPEPKVKAKRKRAPRKPKSIERAPIHPVRGS